MLTGLRGKLTTPHVEGTIPFRSFPRLLCLRLVQPNAFWTPSITKKQTKENSVDDQTLGYRRAGGLGTPLEWSEQ